MSSWPLISDFSRMLQNPNVAFRDPALRECSVEMNNMGQPHPRSGNFATVYRAYKPDGSEVAVRVFNRASGLRRERYQAVSDYIETKKVPSLVGFNYDEKGIRASDGKLYPLVTMEWVPGVTLYEWARDRCREGYGQALMIGADVWLQLVRELAEAGVVHGDLQHANVMVSREGYFKLVDYDCMAVPDLMGQPNTELGMVPYQHPARNEHTQMFLGLDNFSGLMIYVALRALAAAPHLWTTYVDNLGYDKLLFRIEDFENPNASALYHELMNSPDTQVRSLVHYLFQLRNYPLHEIPPISEVLLWCHSLADLLQKQDWDTAVQLVQRMGPQEQIQPELQILVDEAHRRVACRNAVEEAMKKGDEAAVQQHFVPELLQNYPAAAELAAQATVTPQVRQVIEVLAAAKRFQNWDVFKTTWQANRQLLIGRVSAEPYQREMQKLLAADSVLKLLKDPNADTASTMAAWKYLQDMGGHPTAEALKPHIEKVARQQQSLTKFAEFVKHAPETPNLEFDKKLVETWKSQEASAGAASSQPLKQHYDVALTRLKKMARIFEAAKKLTLAGETEVAKLSKDIPTDYHRRSNDRLRQARRRVRAYKALNDAITKGTSEKEVAEAWQILTAADGARIVPDDVRARGEVASQRIPLIKALKGLSDNWPPHEMDAKILEIWKEEVLTGCQEVSPWLPLFNQAKDRRLLLKQLADGIEAGNKELFNQIVTDRRLRNYRFPEEIRSGIEEVREQAEQDRLNLRQSLTNALLDNQRTQFVELFDVELVREICDQFTHHQPIVSTWVEEDVLSPSCVGLTIPEEGGLKKVEPLVPEPPEDEEPQEDKEEVDEKEEDDSEEETKAAEPIDEPPRFIATWNWPEERFSSECRMTICAEVPSPHTSPDDVVGVHSAIFRRDEIPWSTGEPYEFEVPKEWEGHHVLVWAMLDMGFQIYYSQPLELGPIPIEKKKKRWGIF